MPTPNQLAEKIDESASKIPTIMANAQVLAINEIAGAMSRRIFNEGKRTDGGQIGQYSTKDSLVGAKSFRNQGSAQSFFSDDHDWINIKGNSLAKLPGGYKKLRDIQGLQTNFVDLDYKGNLKNSLDVGTVNEIPTIGLTRLGSIPIVEGHEKKYGQIFYPTQEEIAVAVQLASDYILEQFSKEIETWS